MAQQMINLGTVANDGTGDTLRDGGDKINDNFTELYTGLTGLLDFKGSTDCSANPNYPAASKGDYYLVSVAGKIGGASGVVVSAGDSYFATADNAGGTQASVGSSWTVVQGNITYVPVNLAGDTMTGALHVPDDAYDATTWNGSTEVPTKNAVRDKIETLTGGSISTTGSPASGNLTKFSGASSITNGDLSGDVTTSGTLATTIANDAVTTAKINNAAVTLAKIANAAANSKLLGAGASGSGSAYAEITLGTNLSMSGTTLNASGGSGGLTLIGTYTANGSTAVADFTSIAATYKDLIIVANGRNGAAGVADSLALTVNGSSSAIYDRQRLYATNTTVGGSTTLAATSMSLDALAGGGATSGMAGSAVIEIIDYAGTTFWKNIIMDGQSPDSVGSNFYRWAYSGRIRTTSAINQVTLTSATNMVSGSTIYLYGRS